MATSSTGSLEISDDVEEKAMITKIIIPTPTIPPAIAPFFLQTN